MADSTKSVSQLVFKVTTVASNIKELSQLLKNPPFKEQIDEDMRKKISLLSAIDLFPYSDLTKLRNVIESTNKELKQVIVDNDHLFRKLGEE